MTRRMGRWVVPCMVAAQGFIAMKVSAEPSSTAAPRAPVVPQQDPAARLFAQADANRDGSVTRAELASVVERQVQKRIARRFKQLDRNGDGRVARVEVNLMDGARFVRFDVNRDGYFTHRELTLVMVEQLQPRLEQIFASLDVDRDGACSAEELGRCVEIAAVSRARREAVAKEAIAKAASSKRTLVGSSAAAKRSVPSAQ